MVVRKRTPIIRETYTYYTKWRRTQLRVGAEMNEARWLYYYNVEKQIAGFDRRSLGREYCECVREYCIYVGQWPERIQYQNYYETNIR